MKRKTIWRAAAFICGGAICGGMLMGVAHAEAKGSLASWRWKSRLLLVFAPDAGNAQLAGQRHILADARQGARARDLVPIEIIGDRASDSLDAAALRRAHHVAPDRFAVILIGKDGGEKLRRSQPIEAGLLFGLIDTMPMRQQEAARQAMSVHTGGEPARTSP